MSAQAPGTAIATPRGSLATTTVEFCRLLKQRGLGVSPGASQVAVRALGEVDITRRNEFRAALSITLLTNPEDIPLFNYLFEDFWRTDIDDDSIPKTETTDHNKSLDEPDGTPEPDDRDTDETDADVDDDSTPQSLLGDEADGDGETPDDGNDNQLAPAARWGARPGTKTRDQSVSDPAELDRVARALAAELALRRSRRKERHRHGRYIDFRTLMRKSLHYGGLPLTLSWRRPRITRSQLLIFCDVSRSMEQHAKLLLQFASAIFRHAWRVEVFLFANHIVRVTDRWLESDWSDLTSSFADCGGGTEIGESLQAFIADYEYCLTGNKSTVLILSDGLDAGDPAVIERSLAYLKRRSRRVIWLNPLLATRGYEPTARGMAAAMPYVDVFAPAHDANAFWHMVEYLRGGGHFNDRIAHAQARLD